MQQTRVAEQAPLTRPPPAVHAGLAVQMPISLVVGDLQLSPAINGISCLLNSPAFWKKSAATLRARSATPVSMGNSGVIKPN